MTATRVVFRRYLSGSMANRRRRFLGPDGAEVVPQVGELLCLNRKVWREQPYWEPDAEEPSHGVSGVGTRFARTRPPSTKNQNVTPADATDNSAAMPNTVWPPEEW